MGEQRGRLTEIREEGVISWLTPSLKVSVRGQARGRQRQLCPSYVYM